MVWKSFRHCGDFSTSNIFSFENGKIMENIFLEVLFVALFELFDREKQLQNFEVESLTNIIKGFLFFDENLDSDNYAMLNRKEDFSFEIMFNN